jgi:endonuclease/exonuclease/phosphatase family metal-dependent hydrolase
MKILTMNLWHGLSPSNLLWFEALEPVPRKELREKIQLDLIKKIDPDIAYFQEMNPITTKFNHFCLELGRHGGFQPDLVGLKVLGVGLPVNLFSGLSVLAKPSWPLKVVSALRLSGHNSFVSRWASFQLKEERYALFCETMRPNVGKILLVNSHLHHGLEATEEFVENFSKAMDDLKLSPTLRSEIRDRLMAGNERRAKEMSTLLKELERLSSRYEMVILGGDFNSEPSGEIGQRLREHGFTDAWAKDHPSDPGYTYDREHNPANHILQDRFPSTFMIEDCSFDAKTKAVLTKLTVDQERRPRRIDQLWVRGSATVKSIRMELVGFPDAHGMAPSDHFGLVANLDVD